MSDFPLQFIFVSELGRSPIVPQIRPNTVRFYPDGLVAEFETDNNGVEIQRHRVYLHVVCVECSSPGIALQAFMLKKTSTGHWIPVREYGPIENRFLYTGSGNRVYNGFVMDDHTFRGTYEGGFDDNFGFTFTTHPEHCITVPPGGLQTEFTIDDLYGLLIEWQDNAETVIGSVNDIAILAADFEGCDPVDDTDPCFDGDGTYVKFTWGSGYIPLYPDSEWTINLGPTAYQDNNRIGDALIDIALSAFLDSLFSVGVTILFYTLVPGLAPMLTFAAGFTVDLGVEIYTCGPPHPGPVPEDNEDPEPEELPPYEAPFFGVGGPEYLGNYHYKYCSSISFRHSDYGVITQRRMIPHHNTSYYQMQTYPPGVGPPELYVEMDGYDARLMARHSYGNRLTNGPDGLQFIWYEGGDSLISIDRGTESRPGKIEILSQEHNIWQSLGPISVSNTRDCVPFNVFDMTDLFKITAVVFLKNLTSVKPKIRRVSYISNSCGTPEVAPAGGGKWVLLEHGLNGEHPLPGSSFLNAWIGEVTCEPL